VVFGRSSLFQVEGEGIILISEREVDMKTNPWMIVSLVLACVCGFLVGLLVSQPSEVSAAPKKDWFYSTHFTSKGSLVAFRFDMNEENPTPEFFQLNYRDDVWEDLKKTVRRYWRVVPGKERRSQ
jgi:hypothetical protein